LSWGTVILRRRRWRAASRDQDDYPSGADRNQRLAIHLCNRFIQKSASNHSTIRFR
jgi:hypothetical protein